MGPATFAPLSQNLSDVGPVISTHSLATADPVVSSCEYIAGCYLRHRPPKPFSSVPREDRNCWTQRSKSLGRVGAEGYQWSRACARTVPPSSTWKWPLQGSCMQAGHQLLAEMVYGQNCRHCPVFPRMCGFGFQLCIALCPAFFAINTF